MSWRMDNLTLVVHHDSKFINKNGHINYLEGHVAFYDIQDIETMTCEKLYDMVVQLCENKVKRSM